MPTTDPDPTFHMFADSPYGFYMRSTCSRKWNSDDASKAIRRKCENVNASLHVSNAASVTPVSTRDITYRNVYCAVCNHENASDYVHWQAQLYCDVGDQDIKIFKDSITMHKVEQYCSIDKFSPPKIKPRLLDPLRPCIATTLVDQCLPYSNRSSLDEYNCRKRRCESYTDYIFQPPFGPYFKNIDCALCNNFHVEELSCEKQLNRHPSTIVGDGNAPYLRSFSALLGFSGSGKMSFEAFHTTTVLKRCQVGRVFDTTRMQCVDLVCPPGFHLDRHVCQPSLPIAVVVQFTLLSNATIQQFENIAGPSLQDEIHRTLEKLLVNASVKQVSIFIDTINSSLVISSLLEVPNNDNPIAQIETKIRKIQFYYAGIWFKSARSFTVSVATPNAGNRLKCDAYIAINESEYQILTNKSLLHTTSNTLLQPSDYVLSNGTIIRCNQYNRTYTNNVTTSVHTWDYTEPIHFVSAVAAAVLVFSGASLFVTYMLFEKLRTLPGKCTMNYGLAIAISQLFFIVAPGMTANQDVCTAMGLCLHYFMLCQFTWSSILATNLIKTFVFRRLLRDTQSKQSQSRSYTLYCVYGWGAPFVMSMTALILDQKTDVDIYFASSHLCWLQPEDANLVAFMVPVFVILMYNFVAFVFVTFSICRLSRAGSAARSEMADTKGQSAKHTKVFLGTFSLLSLTWIIAFLACIDGTRTWLWGVFSGTCILQGIFIFVVFVLNKNVRRLYANLLRNGKRSMSFRDSLRSTRLWSIMHSRSTRKERGESARSTSDLNIAVETST
ncbi:adhesion G-protein coupled receptor G7-like [Corticium candelabrum]|uniref:adhesion G-protein coupled receptor G7-like n=1 Tax=Corticium candelabrum TaxID=121492 RepID=UPI002E25BC03|nr:adhesion G-protein coupled receptor G7-like [Corticium candelabrum]